MAKKIEPQHHEQVLMLRDLLNANDSQLRLVSCRIGDVEAVAIGIVTGEDNNTFFLAPLAILVDSDNVQSVVDPNGEPFAFQEEEDEL